MWRVNEIIDGKYVVVEELGQGGTGVIYLAYHLSLQKYVVLKKIKRSITSLVKVRQEVDVLKNLHHTYLPQVYDFTEHDDNIYTVIDYIEGHDIDKYLKTGYRFSQEQLIYWLEQLCDVLDYIHNNRPKVIHCDIKPANIMITPDGNVCLIDFNISLDSENSADLSGMSQFYASPEQYEKAMDILSHRLSSVVIDEATDIYSLGATFYHMISGMCPNTGDTTPPLAEIATDYSYDFLRIIDKMMATEKRDRYKNASQVKKAIDRMIRSDTGERRFTVAAVVSSAVYALMLTLGIWMCVYGFGLKSRQQYDAAYSNFVEFCEKNISDEIIDSGLALLNNYSANLDKDEATRGEIHYAIANGHFERGEFAEAASHYVVAVGLISDKEKLVRCYRDYAISLIRQNNTSLAKEIIRQAELLDTDTVSLLLIEAELQSRKGDDNACVDICTRVIAGSSSDELTERAAILKGDALGRLGNYKEQIESYKKAQELNATMSNLRRLGDAYLRYANTLSENYTNELEGCYGNALVCYEKITADEYCLIEDKLNCAVIYLQLDRYIDSKNILLELVDEHKDNYRVFMYLCFACYELGDISETKEYCAEAVRLYEKNSSADKEGLHDSNIIRLYSIEKKLKY